MEKVRVGVLRGGPSPEYDISLKTGASVLKYLNEDKYMPHDLFIARDGTWHSRGIPVSPERALGQVDVVFNALHGKYGEDGEVQKLLDAHSIPYTGSGVIASSVAMNKALAKEALWQHGIKMPRHAVIDVSYDLEDKMYEYFRTSPQPTVIKPLDGGSSVGVIVARSYEELVEGIKKAFELSKEILLEEYVHGREATCGVIEDFRSEDYYAMPPVEIIPPNGHGFFDYDAKYSGETEEICPGGFAYSDKETLRELAITIHKILGLRHYSRSDFIVTPKGIYFLEVNTLPGLTEESLVPRALNAVGCSFGECVDHLLDLAQK
jgi:D-alanine-D-alanine ligase